MRKTFALILSITILLTLSACGRTMDDNIPPNEPSVSNDIPKIETMPDSVSATDNITDEPRQIESGDNNMTDNSIATNVLTPSPSPSATPTATSEPTPVPATMPPSMPTEQTPNVAPQPTTEPTPTPTFESAPTPTPAPEPNIINISITVGGSVFFAKLYDNDTARAFPALLPMTLNMSELNGNEKYYYLPDKLPTDSQKVGNINTGDLMLYGSDCLVLFYESFSTSYSYTRIGYIEDVSGLTDALGSGSVVVALNAVQEGGSM